MTAKTAQEIAEAAKLEYDAYNDDAKASFMAHIHNAVAKDSVAGVQLNETQLRRYEARLIFIGLVEGDNIVRE